ncbi:MAG: arylsulfatase [Verrucomicrobia bacterium]|nr:MAG: arylsulfatase [Verrucomicrobiota bacterium]
MNRLAAIWRSLCVAMAATLPGWTGFGPATAAAAPPEHPNIVIIFADDLGYGDLACYGHPTIRTPNLDRMAAEGMRFTQFYAAASVCTPSRAGLMTGRYPVRSGMCGDRRRVLFPNSKGGLPASELTIAELLKARGYATAAVGKWHLGHHPQYLPTRHGFDHYFGIPYSNDMDRTKESPRGREAFLHPKSEYWRVPLIRDEEEIERAPDQTKLTRRYTEEALDFIRANRRRPFFLYFAHTFPHVPLFASEAFAGKSRRGLYGDVVEELDWSVGQVLETLRQTGLDRRTLVFFTSDNGPWLTQLEQGGSAGLLREGKGSTWEGGMREPAIAWWPGRVPAGTVCRELACTLDLLPTAVELAGGEVPKDRVIDGVSLRPLLFGEGPGLRKSFFYYRGTRLFAARLGPWKAHYITRSAYGRDKPVVHDPPALYHLENDPSEQWDVHAAHPEVIEAIQREVERHRATLVPAPSQLEQ